ncbi:MAG: hypothetical protein ACJ74U_13785 [Jatrophihabitantaceae bacterium]
MNATRMLGIDLGNILTDSCVEIASQTAELFGVSTRNALADVDELRQAGPLIRVFDKFWVAKYDDIAARIDNLVRYVG